MSLRAPAPRIAAPTPTPEVAAAAGYLVPPATPQPIAPPQPVFQQPMPPPAPLPASQPHPAPTPNFLAQTQIATRNEPAPAPTAPAPATPAAQPAPPAMTAPCVRCGERSPEGSRFCHSCGTPVSTPNPILQAPSPQAQPPVQAAVPPAPQPAPRAAPASVVCSRCRGVADPGADFCKFCGARLGEPAAAPRVEPVADPPPQAPAAPPPPAQAEAPTAMTRPLHGIGDVAVRARLVRIAKDGSEGAQHSVTSELTDIGRDEGQIHLADDPYLSPRHARIVTRPAADGTPSLVLTDLGSVNGVYVRLRAGHPLMHGDLLLLGQQVLRFEAVTEIEGARGPAMQHGVLLFGSPAPAARARLVQRTVEGLVRDVFYIVRDEFVIGRENGDRTFPDDVFMSRKHASVRREGSGFVLQDLGSSNGTFVQIHGEHVLHDGDQFRIGHHLFRVDIPAPGSA